MKDNHQQPRSRASAPLTCRIPIDVLARLEAQAFESRRTKTSLASEALLRGLELQQPASFV